MPKVNPTELSKKESIEAVKKILKRSKVLSIRRDFIPGNIIFISYDAKYKENIWDRTPLFMVLRRSTGYTLGLNFHWLPFTMRLWLIQYIIRQNKTNIRDGKPVEFNYKNLKPLLKKLKYAPCVRLYINSRFKRKGAVIPIEHAKEAAEINPASFTGIPAETIYKKILRGQKI